MGDTERQELFLQVKHELWRREIGTAYLKEQVAGARSGNRIMANELLRGIWHSFNPDLRKMRDAREPAKKGWHFLSDDYADYIHQSLTDHFNNGVSLDEAFGVKRRRGHQPVWTDFDEGIMASVPYQIRMVAQDSGRVMSGENAVGEAVEAIIELAASPKTVLYRLGQSMTTERLGPLYWKWREQLKEIETRATTTAWHLIDTHGQDALKLFDPANT